MAYKNGCEKKKIKAKYCKKQTVLIKWIQEQTSVSSGVSIPGRRQMAKRKKFQELAFSDAFMFAAAMEDPELCQGVIERVLGIPVKEVRVHVERSILLNSDYRGIRMDVHADDENSTVYNVEMQTGNKGNLPKRSRFNQSQMDVATLAPRQDVNQLPVNYIIFICTFDPFGDGLYRYTFTNRCQETGVILGDETCKVFLNTKGNKPNGVSRELIDFLNAVEAADIKVINPKDNLLSKLGDRISYLKRSRSMEEQYMLFGEMLDDERREGVLEGLQSGQKMGQTQMLSLITAMTAAGKSEDIAKLETDPEFLKEMFQKYQIS